MKGALALSVAMVALIAGCAWPPGGLPSVPNLPVDNAANQAAGTVEQTATTVDQAASQVAGTVGQTTAPVAGSVSSVRAQSLSAPTMSAPRLGAFGRGGLLGR